MLLNQNLDLRDRSSCTLFFNESERWLHAIWQGYVDPAEAQRGAEAFLEHATGQPYPLLFNDNSRLTGPWFESLDWLADVWVPQAQRLGLRYVAHVVQADQHYDTLTRHLPLHLPFELQIFQKREDASDWLHQMQALLDTPEQ